MKNLFCQLSVKFPLSFCLLGLASLNNFLVTPANAQQATARGSATVTRPSGSFTSVNGEIILPNGMFFDTEGGFSLKVSPTITNAGSNSEQINSLSLTVNTPKGMSLSNVNPVLEATAEAIRNAPTLSDTVSLIRSIDINSLGALD
ncbi:hypothetical protein [Nostoc sp. CCY0012]|uniref:hypothetical protein n=1 Tax=Nostoc sp. CCY0012 TaxID=1056123 RepID=UPI0039C5EE75